MSDRSSTTRGPAPVSGALSWIELVGLAVVTTGLVLGGVLAMPASSSAAELPVALGAAATYSVLGGQTVTSTGGTALSGDLGVSPGTSITGFPPGTVAGETHAGDAVAAQAQIALQAAYADAAGRAPTATISGDLVGQTLLPGVYNAASTIAVSGTLTLDGDDNLDSVFIFQVGTTLTTAAASHIVLINGAQACNVFWQIGTSATLGAGTSMRGTIMAAASITIGAATLFEGAALARDASVTLDSDTFTTPPCEAELPPTTTTTEPPTTTTTEPPTTTTTEPPTTTTTEPPTTTTTEPPTTTTTEPPTTTTTEPPTTTTTEPPTTTTTEPPTTTTELAADAVGSTTTNTGTGAADASSAPAGTVTPLPGTDGGLPLTGGALLSVLCFLGAALLFLGSLFVVSARLRLA